MHLDRVVGHRASWCIDRVPTMGNASPFDAGGIAPRPVPVGKSV